MNINWLALRLARHAEIYMPANEKNVLYFQKAGIPIQQQIFIKELLAAKVSSLSPAVCSARANLSAHYLSRTIAI